LVHHIFAWLSFFDTIIIDIYLLLLFIHYYFTRLFGEFGSYFDGISFPSHWVNVLGFQRHYRLPATPRSPRSSSPFDTCPLRARPPPSAVRAVVLWEPVSLTIAFLQVCRLGLSKSSLNGSSLFAKALVGEDIGWLSSLGLDAFGHSLVACCSRLFHRHLMPGLAFIFHTFRWFVWRLHYCGPLFVCY